MTAFFQAFGAAAVVIVVSVVLGQAICAAGGGEIRWWAAPAVGLAALVVLAGAAIQLPGDALTAAIVVALALGAAAATLLRRGVFRLQWGDLVVGVLALLGASVPFIASGRVGLPGVSLDNDSANHLLWAEALRSTRMAKLWGPQNGYPLGPHSVVAALGTATRVPLDMAFTGLLIAIVPITALVAAGVLGEEPLWRRAAVGVMCSLAYLLAAYYAEGAFKETIMAGLLLAFVVHGDQVRAHWDEVGSATRLLRVIPAVVLVAGAVYTYSYVGVGWFGLSIALWVVAGTASQPALLSSWISRRRLSAAAPWLVGTALLGVIVVLPVAGQAIAFFHTIGGAPVSKGAVPAPLGNLVGPLPPYEALGIWSSPVFQFAPANAFHAGELSAFALGVLVYGLVWSLRRRQLLMPAAVIACGLIWLLSKHGGAPYVSAKALVIAAPLVMAAGLRSLLSRREGRSSTHALPLAFAALFCAFAAYSSYQVLRSEPVQAPEAGRELAAFHRTLGNSAVLFLGDDDYSPWQLRDATVGALASNTVSAGGAAARVNKPYVLGQPLDFDSVDPRDLDHFRYVITSNTPFASQGPANFRLLDGARLYDLWERTGPTVPRDVLEPPGAPGAILNCRSPLGRKLRARRGQASIMAAPVTVPGPGVLPGATAAVPLALPQGEWELSIQYLSSLGLELSTPGGKHWTMPAYLGRPGPFFSVGAVRGRDIASPVVLIIRTQRPSPLTGDRLAATISLIAAIRLPDTRRIVPLRQACGKYIDWYRLT